MDKKIIKPVIIGLIVLLFIIFLIIIYKNIFAGTSNNRFRGVEKYKITNNEKNSIESTFKQNDKVKSVKVYINNKIINIMVVLKEDIEFDDMKTLANNALSNFNKKNLSFFDIEIFIKSLNKDSEIYPKIGYKFKDNSEFSW